MWLGAEKAEWASNVNEAKICALKYSRVFFLYMDSSIDIKRANFISNVENVQKLALVFIELWTVSNLCLKIGFHNHSNK